MSMVFYLNRCVVGLAIGSLVSLSVAGTAMACPNGWSGNPCRPGLGNGPIKKPKGGLTARAAQTPAATATAPLPCRLKNGKIRHLNPNAPVRPPGPISPC